ncbi:cupin domain-containing protein [Ilumatobacter sp.]|uniref:cupin domain-containing protein n=1 Tax=Ilumatobacter sp. TaxID=1967498 RepID=UPI003AF52D85
MIRDVHVVVGSAQFDDDLQVLTTEHGFRVDAIFPADAPSTAVISAHGVRLRLERSERSERPAPVRFRLLSDDATGTVELPGGSTLEFVPFSTTYDLPDNVPSLTITADDGTSGVGRAGMRYRDLLPDRWGGRFIASHITIPEGGPVPDYVHFHKVRFQMIFVKSGWVRLVYEDQGPPFVMHAGDCVLQPPEIRHRVLESSPGLEVVEIGCPAEHETIADWSLPLPSPDVDPAHDFGGQRFVRHVASEADYAPWRLAGWEHRDTGIAAATVGLAGARVARPVRGGAPDHDGSIAHDTEFCQLVVLSGSVTFTADDGDPVVLAESDSVAIPGGTRYRLSAATADCEVLDVTLPASFTVTGS